MTLGQMKRQWEADTGPDRYRRGLYTFFWRATPHPVPDDVFDAPDGVQACTRRLRSNTPLQALTLLNDQAFVEIAQGLAGRIVAERPADERPRADSTTPSASAWAASPADAELALADAAARTQERAELRERRRRAIRGARACRPGPPWPASCSTSTSSSPESDASRRSTAMTRDAEPTAGLSCCSRQTRRHFFADCGVGLGGDGAWRRCWRPASGRAAVPSRRARRRPNPLAVRPGHFPPRAKSVIYLFMAGGPSQLELFDYKPELQKYNGQPIPESFIKGQRFAFMDIFTKEHPKLLGTRRKFARHGQSGAWVSECLPHLAGVVDDLAFVRSVATDVFNHAPAKLFVNTGSQPVRPAEHGRLGHLRHRQRVDRPARLRRPPVRPARPARRGGQLGQRVPAHGLPGRPVPLRRRADPQPGHARRASPTGGSGGPSTRSRELNRARLDATGDPEIATRIAAYEMAYRMQTSAPELIDLGSRDGRDAASCTAPSRASRRSPTTACWPAGWSSAASASSSSITPTGTTTAAPARPRPATSTQVCRDIDQPCAALIQDLKTRGLLDDTLVVWGGEFGRTPMGEIREIDRPQPPHRRLHHVAGRRRRQAGPHPRRDRRVRLRAGGRPGPRPRPPGDDPAPAGPGPHAS